ncbi:hypothetical protein SAMN04489842_2147 [Natronobacterium texcoconense]|uniref:LexA-binding, inner membrane-associated hydrolase n=2 Tax=Natronobacterium texcoconense TaxID=1095778 RepID=A0A1H1FXB8_NATTX|nr:hypothetical protein SAMN04489842_2147 [Natronobacterium texcoconense]
MLPTHALGGMALALPLVAVAPELAPIALAAGLLGGIFPDLDMYTGHRKTLHFPVYYSLLAAGATVVAVLVPTTMTVAVALFLLGAALHCVTDVFGSGLELRPWEGNSERAVYDHYRGTWIAPRQLVRYDGSPGDLLLSVTLAVPLLYALEGVLQWVVIAAIVVAAVYTAFRRILAELAPVVVRRLPASVLPYVPDRYLEDVGSDRSWQTAGR